MPQRTREARLAIRQRPGRDPVYVIRDVSESRGRVEISTGTADRTAAETALAAHIAGKARRRGPAAPTDITIAEILELYGREHAPTVAAPARLGYAIEALLRFWGELSVDAVKGPTCRRYARERAAEGDRRYRPKEGEPAPPLRPLSNGTIRRELNVLGAALNYALQEGYLTTAPKVTLPQKPETTQRALTRAEAARLIRVARTRGQHHIARFIIVSLYTGTRLAACLNLRLSGPSLTGGWFDLDAGLLYRKGDAERSTKKRRTPSRLPRQLAAHARRWAAGGSIWAVEFRGARVASIKTAWAKIAADAKLGWSPTPHSLKHTAITWAIQGGATVADAAAYFATSIETIERVYWHLSPNFQQGAVAAMEGRGRVESRSKSPSAVTFKQANAGETRAASPGTGPEK